MVPPSLYSFDVRTFLKLKRMTRKMSPRGTGVAVTSVVFARLILPAISERRTLLK